MIAPPVPPKTSHSALPTNPFTGFAGPSDWEHFSADHGDVEDAEAMHPEKGTTPSRQSTTALSPKSCTAVPNAPPATHPSETVTSPSNVSPTIQVAHAPEDTGMQSRVSPVSPRAGHTPQGPYPPVRVDSAKSEYSSLSGGETAEHIDGLIEAWNRPVLADTDTMAQAPSPLRQKASPVETDQPMQDYTSHQKNMQLRVDTGVPSPSPGGAIAHTGVPATSAKPADPCENLEPWSKSSLERFVAMLHKEQVADSDAERFKIFTAFMAKETKLREILYNVEQGPKTEEDTARQQATPSGPPAERSDAVTPFIDSGLIPVELEEDNFQTPSYHPEAEYPEDGSYSPGGRPILPRLYTPANVDLHRSASQPSTRKYGPDKNTDAPSGRSTSVPPSSDNSQQKQELTPLATNPPQAIYTPFRYTEGPQRGSDKLKFDRPAHQAYSALRQASAESGRLMANAPIPRPATASQGLDNQDETFIGLIREKSVAYRTNEGQGTSSPSLLPASLRQGKMPGPLDELRSMVSKPLAKHVESSWHVTTRKDLEKFPDKFNYMAETLKLTEESRRSRREELDKERMRRQEESEAHIDALFNDKEIGYADINLLEEEFRQTEARAQLEEERRELADFIATVFDPLDGRLNEEISSLRTQYDSALAQLDNENSKIKESSKDRSSLSHTMKAVNAIYQKLEIRYQKRLGIALDRERRRKKAERRPLVFMGDSLALKQLDSEFDQMERRNILEAAKDRDDRANRLMDSFDDAIMHGLGENQRLIDEISAKVTDLDASALQASDLTDAEIEQTLKSVFTLVESLRQDSESILHDFGIADSGLNNADYCVSVAEAKYSNADPSVTRRLDQEKKKEDAKIQRDLASKLDSIRAGPAEITSNVNKLLTSIGKAPVVEQAISSESAQTDHPIDSLLPGPRAPTVGPGPNHPGEDPNHQQRMRKALDDAKKRNAARVKS